MSTTSRSPGVLVGYRLTTTCRDTIVHNLNYGPVREALDAADSNPALSRSTLYLWEIWDTCSPSVADGTIQEWRLVTLTNPAPQRHRTLHDADCDPEEYGYCACTRTMPIEPPALCNLFAGATLSTNFHLSPNTRARLLALGWPVPQDATQWTYPGDTDRCEEIRRLQASVDAVRALAPGTPEPDSDPETEMYDRGYAHAFTDATKAIDTALNS